VHVRNRELSRSSTGEQRSQQRYLAVLIVRSRPRRTLLDDLVPGLAGDRRIPDLERYLARREHIW